MQYYQPADEPATERVLFITVEHKDGGDYRHLRAYVLRRVLKSAPNPDRPGQTIYGDGADACGYRNAAWSSGKANAILVDNLAARAQMTIREFDGKPAESQRCYGSDYSFYDIYKLERRESKLINESFRKLDAGMAKLVSSFGYVNDDNFAELCIRLSKVLGIKTFITERSPSHRGANLTDAKSFIEFNVTSVAAHVNALIASCYLKPSN